MSQHSPEMEAYCRNDVEMTKTLRRILWDAWYRRDKFEERTARDIGLKPDYLNRSRDGDKYRIPNKEECSRLNLRWTGWRAAMEEIQGPCTL